MTWLSTIIKASLLLHGASAAIVPQQQSIIWKYEGKNFWASLDLNAESFALESPAGSAPDALVKRGAGSEFQACTLLSLDGDVTEAVLQGKIAEYQKLKDDVWSASQVRFVLLLFKSVLTIGSLVNVSLFTHRSRTKQMSTLAP